VAENLAVATGRRKTAVARAFLRQGTGKITVNGKTPEEYFAIPILVSMAKSPLKVTSSEERYDVTVTIAGGGPSGQAEACRHALARALTKYDQSNRSSLRANGFLRRDPRMVERKKYGRRGARRRFQFSKR
jgi:small subunit ribosomal protein S9